jgi:hypothetical protein
MKKITIITLSVLLSIKGISQEFMGVKVGGSKESISNQFTSKGMKKVTSSNPNMLIFEGYIAGSTTIELYVAFTPKTNVAWKFMVYLPKSNDWYNLKTQYNKYVALFTEKYGQPNSSYSEFLTPYYEGDGYEMSAIGLNKCIYSSFWETYAVEITEYKQVMLSYENKDNASLNKTEKNQINNANF